MIITGNKIRQIYPQNNLNWEKICSPIGTGDYYNFYFSGQNGNELIFQLKNNKIYSKNNGLLGGYNSNDTIVFSGNVSNNTLDLYKNNDPLYIGLSRNFTGLVSGFFIESKNFSLDISSLSIFGEQPSYFFSNNLLYNSGDQIPVTLNNSGKYPIIIYSGEVISNNFTVNGLTNLNIPSNDFRNFYLINNGNFSNDVEIVYVKLYSNLGTEDLYINLSGTLIDNNLFYITVSPPVNTIFDGENLIYNLSLGNASGTNLEISLEYISGITGDYYRDVQRTGYLTGIVSGLISGQGFIQNNLTGLISGFNSLRNNFEYGTGSGLISTFKIADNQLVSGYYDTIGTGVGNVDFITDIIGSGFANNILYSGFITYQGGNLTGYSNINATGYILGQEKLGFITNAVDTIFQRWTGDVPLDLNPDEYETITLQSPFKFVTGTFQTGLKNILGLGYATGRQLTGFLQGDFGSNGFEPGIYRFEKPFEGILSGIVTEYTGFDPVKLEIKDTNITGFISTTLYKTLIAQGCKIDLNFNLTGTGIPNSVAKVPNGNVSPVSIFNTLPIYSGDYLYENSYSTSPYSFTEKIYGTSNSQFGSDIKISKDGNVMVIGASSDNNNTGSASIFINDISGWNFKQKISGNSPNAYFGFNLNISENADVIIMGSFLDNGNTGSAMIFTGDSVNGWNFVQKISGSGSAGQFGRSLACSDDAGVIVMGGPADNNSTGTAMIFTGNNNRWVFKQKISGIRGGGFSNPNYGTSSLISNNGEIIVIGGPTDLASNLGAAMIFTGNPNIGWNFSQRISGSGTTSRFGTSLASSDNCDVIMMGGPFHDLPLTENGAAMIFTGNLYSPWALRQRITGNILSTEFGRSLATNNNASIIAMGSIKENNSTGSAMIFTGDAINGWSFVQKISGSGITNSQFGTSLEMSNAGRVLVMGGSFDDSAMLFNLKRTSISSPTGLFNNIFQVPSYQPKNGFFGWKESLPSTVSSTKLTGINKPPNLRYFSGQFNLFEPLDTGIIDFTLTGYNRENNLPYDRFYFNTKETGVVLIADVYKINSGNQEFLFRQSGGEMSYYNNQLLGSQLFTVNLFSGNGDYRILTYYKNFTPQVQTVSVNFSHSNFTGCEKDRKFVFKIEKSPGYKFYNVSGTITAKFTGENLPYVHDHILKSGIVWDWGLRFDEDSQNYGFFIYPNNKYERNWGGTLDLQIKGIEYNDPYYHLAPLTSSSANFIIRDDDKLECTGCQHLGCTGTIDPNNMFVAPNELDLGNDLRYVEISLPQGTNPLGNNVPQEPTMPNQWSTTTYKYGDSPDYFSDTNEGNPSNPVDGETRTIGGGDVIIIGGGGGNGGDPPTPSPQCVEGGDVNVSVSNLRCAGTNYEFDLNACAGIRCKSSEATLYLEGPSKNLLGDVDNNNNCQRKDAVKIKLKEGASATVKAKVKIRGYNGVQWTRWEKIGETQLTNDIGLCPCCDLYGLHEADFTCPQEGYTLEKAGDFECPEGSRACYNCIPTTSAAGLGSLHNIDYLLDILMKDI